MANKTKRYDLKAADRRRNMLIQVGLTAVVIIFAVGLVLVIIKPWAPSKKPGSRSARRRGAVDQRGGAGQSGQGRRRQAEGRPVDVRGLPLPALREFRERIGPHGQAAHRHRRGSGRLLHGRSQRIGRWPANEFYSSRAGNAAYCVAEADPSPTKDAFRRFHAALYAQQPGETSTSFPTNDQLIACA